jgi:hypothetical protein
MQAVSESVKAALNARTEAVFGAANREVGDSSAEHKQE